MLTCKLEVHRHTEQCRDSEGELTCGQADYAVHVHNDDCYGEDGALVCALPEAYISSAPAKFLQPVSLKIPSCLSFLISKLHWLVYQP